MKSRIFGFLISLVLGAVFLLPPTALAEGFLAETITNLKTQIADLEARLIKLQSLERPSSGQDLLNHSYQLGETGSVVTALQDFLRGQGFFKLSQSSGYFGEITKKALESYIYSLEADMTTPPIVATSTSTTTSTTTEPMTTVHAFGLMAVKPVAEAIDAGNPVSGWQEFEFSFNPDPKTRWKRPVVADFEVETTDPEAKLEVIKVTTDGDVVVKLNKPIPTGEWTTLIHKPTKTNFRFGFLPGDVNQDSLVSYEDLLLLIDVVNKLKTAPDYAVDIDRNDTINRADQLAWLNLINGTNDSEVWRGHSLPKEPPVVKTEPN